MIFHGSTIYCLRDRLRDALMVAIAASASAVSAEVHLRVGTPEQGGQYATVQAAVDAVPASNTERYVIDIMPGTYTARVKVPSNKPFITLRGEDPLTTILTFNETANTPPNESTAHASTVVQGADFIAENLTFANSYGPGVQALAIYAKADRLIFNNCHFLGWQDTLRSEFGRHYFYNVYVEGSVDFIYGKGTAYFENSTLYPKSSGYITAQGREGPAETNGYVFKDSTITGSAANNSVYLGRPWQAYSRAVFIDTKMGPVVRPEGWSVWSGNTNHLTAYFAEYNSMDLAGNPLNVSQRVSWSHQLTAAEAAAFSKAAWLGGADGWNPVIATNSPGDFNADGTFDAADFVAWRKIDGTALGYDLWRERFGSAAAGVAAGFDSGGGLAWSSVPEPVSSALGGLGVLALMGVCGRRAWRERRRGACAARARRTGWMAFCIATVGILWPCAAYAIPAFSGAEGPGSNASGGRGGDVYHVTRLDFDLDGTIPGTLKYGIVNAPAAGRTIVFDVGGTIFQNGGGAQYWFRSGRGNITIAGQTAPGGITIAGVGTKFTGDNIVLRNITVRPNKDPVNPVSFTYDGISTQATNSIIDHVTVTWHTDEGISATDAVNNTTVQYSMIGEGLNYDSHSYGSIISTEVDDAPIGYHHNVYAHNNSRVPRLGSEGGTGAVATFYNNVIYNWINRAGYSGAAQPSRTNIVNNYYITGASNGTTIFTSADTLTQLYQSGNMRDTDKDGQFDGTLATWSHFAGTETQLASPVVVETGVVDTADAGRDRALDYGGANWWTRHAVDARIVGSVRTGTGAIINDAPAAEWNAVLNAPLVTRPADWDTDQDGMPNAWEAEHGLDPAAPEHNGDFDADGYTNLEEYVNEIAAWPAPRAIVFSGATNSRYAQITNWDIQWQPSRFDTAVINNGTATVDSVGQHAGNLLLARNAGDNATLNITGGWIEVEDAPHGLSDGITVIGDNNAATAVLNLSGGRLTTKTLLQGAGGSFHFTGGVLSAETIHFDLVNNGGVLAPGRSPGMTNILGNYTTTSGALEIELSSAGSFDTVDVTGNVALGGELVVKLLGGFVPGALETFTVLTGASIGGSFANLDPGGRVGVDGVDGSFLVTIGEQSVTLSDFSLGPPVLAGDYNDDGVVDAADYVAWRKLAGTQFPLANETASIGDVDGEDYSAWQGNFGATGGGGSAGASVPEPASAFLVLLAWCAMRAGARRKAALGRIAFSGGGEARSFGTALPPPLNL